MTPHAIAARLAAEPGVVAVVLGGSQARGTAAPDSDVDLGLYYDPASPPVLLDVPDRGATIPAVAQAGKTGWVYILDRRTGKLLRRSEPFVPQQHIFAAPTAEGTRIAPGTRGGSNWPSAAFSPKTGAMYVLGSHIPMLLKIEFTRPYWSSMAPR